MWTVASPPTMDCETVLRYCVMVKIFLVIIELFMLWYTYIQIIQVTNNFFKMSWLLPILFNFFIYWLEFNNLWIILMSDAYSLFFLCSNGRIIRSYWAWKDPSSSYLCWCQINIRYSQDPGIFGIYYLQYHYE